MAMASTLTTSSHSRKVTAAENIAQMHKQYRIGRNTNGSEKKQKKVAATNDGGHKTSLAEVGDFKQQCYGCRKVGQKKNDYPDKKEGNGGCGGGGRGKGSSNNNKENCNHCGFKGHIEAKCWKKHPELRPEKGELVLKIWFPWLKVSVLKKTNRHSRILN